MAIAVVLVALAGALPAADDKSPGQIEVHVGGLQAASCDRFEARHEAQKIIDLLVSARIEDPTGSARLPLPSELAASLKVPAARIASCKDHVAQALVAALQGEFGSAKELLSRKPEGTGWCGNALAAEMFGSAEALASIAFLRGTYADVAAFQLPEIPSRSLESVDVHSSRWALAYAMRATANEQLGRRADAVRDSCVAAEQAQEFDESWGYYYSSDPVIWQAITHSVEQLRKRLGGACT